MVSSTVSGDSAHWARSMGSPFRRQMVGSTNSILFVFSHSAMVILIGASKSCLLRWGWNGLVKQITVAADIDRFPLHSSRLVLSCSKFETRRQCPEVHGAPRIHPGYWSRCQHGSGVEIGVAAVHRLLSLFPLFANACALDEHERLCNCFIICKTL